MKFETRTRDYQNFIEAFLADYFKSSVEEPQKVLFDSMKYSLLAGGKRLRPIFAFEFCRMITGSWKEAAPFAAAVEMIHTYSLIHDDLPCMDNDDYRRGKLTNHKVFGEAIAVLAGDALLTDAFAMAATAEIKNPFDHIRAISVLSECAGSMGMVGGQILDILSEERECTEQEVIDIQSRKTGRLITAPCVLGVLAGGGTEEQIQAAAEFSALLGLAFQIRDDMLDVIGNAEELGKSVGTDKEKNTFVRLYGLERCEELVRKYTNLAISKLDIFPENEYMISLAKYLTSRNK